MSAELLATTNKARIWLESDGTVTKEFFAQERARGEYRCLRELASLLGSGSDIEGWCYRGVEVLGFDAEHARVRMARVTGQPLAELLNRDRSAGRHLGIWLGLFHQAAALGPGTVRLYSDVSVHNLLVDVSGRTVTAVDPGLGFGRTGSPAVDVLMGAASLVNHAAKVPTLPVRLVRPYFDGYGSTGMSTGTGPAYEEAVEDVIRRLRRKQVGLGPLPRRWFGAKLACLEGYLLRRVPHILASTDAA